MGSFGSGPGETLRLAGVPWPPVPPTSPRAGADGGDPWGKQTGHGGHGRVLGSLVGDHGDSLRNFVPRPGAGSWTLASVGALTPRKPANTTNQDFLPFFF